MALTDVAIGARKKRHMDDSNRPTIGRLAGIAGATALLGTTLVAGPPVAAGPEPQPGPNNAITDVPGIRVGQFERDGHGYLTGTTVVHAPARAVGGVDVRGGAPGTRETDLLDPRNLVQQADAITLTGGSAYGLNSAAGVMRWLEEHNQGFQVDGGVVPIVPGAVIYDLGRGGDFGARPSAGFGYRAIDDAKGGPVAQGNVGAGTGAISGGLKGGVGTASVVLDNGLVVGAIVVVNSAGSAVNPDTCTFYAEYLEVGNEFGGLRAPSSEQCASSDGRSSPATPRSTNTTIAVVATNAPLDKEEAQKMAGVAHDGLARAISPMHTLYDGDSVFALSTGVGVQAGVPGLPGALAAGDLNKVYSGAADTLSRAVVHAMLAAKSAAGTPSYCDKYPNACGQRRGASSMSGQLTNGDRAARYRAVSSADATHQHGAAAGAARKAEPDDWGISRVAWPAIALAVAVAILVLTRSRVRRRN